ncbi:MAG: hypothetical protein JJU33_06805 [Phycisphaerales bacterium]|nr:hypothetical protein [Phycisphaerales bacterium]
MAYTSSLTYEPERIHAAAIYCSDGRVGAHFDDFLTHGLKLPRYDRVALPGGPASLAGHTETHLEEKGVVDELRFLVEAHELERVVLIAHQGCAFYGARLKLPEAYLEPQQRIDLLKAADRVREITGITEVDAFFARLDLDARRISFDPVSVTR